MQYTTALLITLDGGCFMSTSSRTWFYAKPEPRPYYIEERVNHTLWKNRVQGLFMTCTQTENPIKMEGNWNGIPVLFEWEPGNYFILRMGEERKDFIGVMRQILLGLIPVITYQDLDGLYALWKDIQGNPQYQGLRRLKSPQQS
jgi:hypothetical protein